MINILEHEAVGDAFRKMLYVVAFAIIAFAQLLVLAETIPVAAGGDVAAAVASASDGDVVQLAAGTFTLSQEISVTSGITVKGVGRSLTRIVSDGSSHRLFTLNNANAVLSDLTLSGATCSGSGGAVNLSNGTLRDLVIRDCSATGHGGGIYAAHGMISRVILHGCTAGGQGGGINCATSSDTAIDNVAATGCTAQWGGGIYYDSGSTVVVRNCTFAGNVGTSNGPDAYYYSSGVTCVNCYAAIAFVNNVGSGATRTNCSDLKRAAQFLGLASANLRIGDDSQLIGAGNVSVGALVDLAGRTFGASVAIGAFQPVATEGTRLDLSANEVAFGGSLTITPHLATATGTLLVIDDTATVQELAAADGVGVVWTPSARGVYSLVLKDSDGQNVVDLYNAVFVGESEVHVNASATLAAAFATVIDGGTIWFDAGEHSFAASVLLDRPLTLRSANGRDNSVIRAQRCGAFVLANLRAKVYDLTIRGDNGAAIDSSAVTFYHGTLERCIVENFLRKSHGAAVEAKGVGGLVEGCIIRNNQAPGYGGAVYVAASLPIRLRNTLFYGNSGASWGADVYTDGPGEMVNCTLADVPSSASQGSLCRCNNAFAVTNCLMRRTSWYSGAGNRSNNLDSFADDLFVNAADNDYRLASTAATAIDQGLDAVVSATEKDALGARRISGEHVDIGACEYSAAEFSASFELEGTATSVGDVVTLVPVIVNGNDPVNRWRIVNLATGTSVTAQTHGNGAAGAYAYTITSLGLFSFYYDVTDGDNEVSASKIEALVVKVAGDVTVAVSAVPTAPFDTPATALTNLNVAAKIVDAGATISLLEGTHRITERVRVPAGVSVIGAGINRTTVTLDQNAPHGFFTLSSKTSRLADLTILGSVGSGYMEESGIGVSVSAGRVEDVRITGVKTVATVNGSAIALLGADAVASRLWIDDCSTAGYGTVYLNGGGHIDNTLVRTSVAGYGHCLYLNNFNAGSTATNCTCIGRGDTGKYDIWAGGGKVVNCIISGYAQTDGRSLVSDRFYNCAYSCADLCEPEGTDNGNFHVTDFGFVDAANDDYHLTRESALLGRGRVDYWMKSARDLDGSKRVCKGKTDIGCYQRLTDGFKLLVQ